MSSFPSQMDDSGLIANVIKISNLACKISDDFGDVNEFELHRENGKSELSAN